MWHGISYFCLRHEKICFKVYVSCLSVDKHVNIAKPEDLETCPNHLSFRFLTKVRSSSYFPMAVWVFLRTTSSVTWSLYEMFSNLR